jgi:hypothetical protein
MRATTISVAREVRGSVVISSVMRDGMDGT